MNGKTVWVRDRFHEQREYPKAHLDLRLKKGTIVEELDWEKKTEKVTIHKRLILERFKQFKIKGDKKNKYILLTFKKDDFAKNKRKKMKLVKQILKEQYPVLSYSFFNSFISSTHHKMDFSFLDAQKFIKEIIKGMKKNAKKKKMIEKDGGLKL